MTGTRMGRGLLKACASRSSDWLMPSEVCQEISKPPRLNLIIFELRRGDALSLPPCPSALLPQHKFLSITNWSRHTWRHKQYNKRKTTTLLRTYCGRAILWRRDSHSKMRRPPIRSQLRLMAMNEAPEVDIKVRQDTYASAFNSFIPCLLYISHDPSPAYLCEPWQINGCSSQTFFFITQEWR